MQQQGSIKNSEVQRLINSGLSESALEEDLKARKLDAGSIVEYLKLIKKQRSKIKQSKGFVYMAIGAFIGFLSCVFTITELFPGATGFVLYGLTSIAVLLVVYGLYLVFE